MANVWLYFSVLAPFSALANSFEEDITAALIQRTTHQVTYDGSYRSISYPGGDVPSNIGAVSYTHLRAHET